MSNVNAFNKFHHRQASTRSYVNTVLSMVHFAYAMVYLMNIIEDVTRARWTRYFRLIIWGYKWDITTQSYQYLPSLYIWLAMLNKCSWIISLATTYRQLTFSAWNGELVLHEIYFKEDQFAKDELCSKQCIKEYNVHAGFVLQNKLLKFICQIKARIVNYF